MGIFDPNGASNAPQRFALHRLLKSSFGVVLPIIYGTTLVAPTIIWAGDPDINQPSGILAKLAAGKGGTTITTYSLSVQLALCEGPIFGVLSVLETGGAILGTAHFDAAYIAANWSVGLGGVGQAEWSYLNSGHPEAAYHYTQTAWLGIPNLNLGPSVNLPQIRVEVQGILAVGGARWGWRGGAADALPDAIMADFLSNGSYGCGVDPALIGHEYWNTPFPFFFTAFQDLDVWCQAAGIGISPIYDRRENASKWITEILEITQSECIFTNEQFFFLPYADKRTSGASAGDPFHPIITYDPTNALAPVRNLGKDDFVCAEGAPAVEVARALPQDLYNKVMVEYLHRGSNYNIHHVTVQNLNSIRLSQARMAPTQQYHAICRPNVGRMVAAFRLQRLNLVANNYKFKLNAIHADLDPMDCVTLTDPSIGLNGQLVRLMKITEIDDLTLECEAQDIWSATQQDFSSVDGQSGLSLAFDSTDIPPPVN